MSQRATSPAFPLISWRDLTRQGAVMSVSLLLSLGLHLGVLAPYLLQGLWVDDYQINGPEDGGDGPLGNAAQAGGDVAAGEAPPPPLQTPIAPVRISLYVPPAPKPPEPAEVPPDAAPTTAPTAEPVASTAPKNTSSPSTSTGTGSGGGSGSSGSGAGGDNATGGGQDITIGGVVGRPPRGNKKPCDPIEEVVQISDTKWKVERDLIDYYATHLNQLGKQAGTSTHTNADGEKDGVQLYLPRCSVLRQGGLKNGDIIHSINGRPVATLAQAVATWMRVRNDRNITVKLTRKNGEAATFQYRITN